MLIAELKLAREPRLVAAIKDGMRDVVWWKGSPHHAAGEVIGRSGYHPYGAVRYVMVPVASVAVVRSPKVVAKATQPVRRMVRALRSRAKAAEQAVEATNRGGKTLPLTTTGSRRQGMAGYRRIGTRPAR